MREIPESPISAKVFYLKLRKVKKKILQSMVNFEDMIFIANDLIVIKKADKKLKRLCKILKKVNKKLKKTYKVANLPKITKDAKKIHKKISKLMIKRIFILKKITKVIKKIIKEKDVNKITN